MTYVEQSERYRNQAERLRYEMCISEQAVLTYAADPDAANSALADEVIKGDAQAIDSVIRTICVGPNSATLGNDADLMAAVQAAWPGTAQAWSTGG